MGAPEVTDPGGAALDPEVLVCSYYRDAELRGSNLIYRLLRIGKRAGVPRHPVDLLALTVVVEQRALRRYQEHLKRENVPQRTLEVLRAVSKDEGWHIDWVRRKARELAEKEGDPDRYDRTLPRIDKEVYAELEGLERSWHAVSATFA